MKFLIAGIVAVLLIIGLLTLLPKNVTSPITSVFNKKAASSASPSPTTIAATSPVPSLSLSASPTAQPTISLAKGSPRTITDPRTGSTIVVTASPVASGSGQPKQVADAGLPGTGETTKDPIMLTLQALLCSLIIILGWKLSKYLG